MDHPPATFRSHSGQPSAPPQEPPDRLRTAIAHAAPVHAMTRLVSIGTLPIIGAECDIAVVFNYANGKVAHRAVVADPLRLPLVESFADVAIIQVASTAVAPVLREIWRILAPAGILVLVIMPPPKVCLKLLTSLAFRRQRTTHVLAAAMFATETWTTIGTVAVVRATKRDGLSPIRRQPAAAPALAAAQPRLARTNTA